MIFFEKKEIPYTEENDDISRKAKLVSTMIAEFNKNTFFRENVRGEFRVKSDIDKRFNYKDIISAKKITRENYVMEFIERNDTKSDMAVLQLHGGGYEGAFKNIYRTMAGLYTEVSRGAAVLTPDYRVAPDNPFPAALYDAYDAYRWLVENGYTEDKIIVAGDSAGGGLALALGLYIRSRGERMPGGFVLMSPWADLTCSGSSYEENFDSDIMFGGSRESLLFNNTYPGTYKKDNPFISPVFGDFTGFPPMLIQVGTNEMLLSDARTVAGEAKSAGVKVRLSEYRGMFHVFQMGAKLMPESVAAWSEVGKYFEVIRGL